MSKLGIMVLLSALSIGLLPGAARGEPEIQQGAEATSNAAEGAGGEGEIKVAANVDGAAVEIDGVSVGNVPLDRRAPAGEHRLVVSLDGYLPYSTTIQMESHSARMLDVTLVTEAEGPRRANAPFFAMLGVACAGLATAIAGWVVLGQREMPVNPYEEAMSSDAWSDWSVSNCETATKPDGTSASADDADWDYYCNELVIGSREADKEAEREWDKKTTLGIGLGVGGTVLFAIGGTLAVIFIAKPELVSGKKSEGRLMIVPVATNDTAGFLVGGRF